MNTPLISVLIPFKNTEKFLSECLNSIINQTYKNWEVLAINDHSTDGSTSLINTIATSEKRISVYENSGEGIIDALRTAYAKSNGVLITRMDSDDIMSSNKLQVMTNALHKFGKGYLAIGQVKYFSENGINNGYYRYEKWLNKLTANGLNFSEIYKECVIPSPCWMVYREDLDNCSAFKPNVYPEDYDLAFRFREANLICIPCNKKLHYWRDYDTRTSRTSEHYAQNHFLDLKLHYFLKSDFDKTRPLVIWGAGNKGKNLARKLQHAKIKFIWLCDNPNKIGKNIYGVVLKKYQFLEQLENPQSIITVANNDAQDFITNYLKTLQQQAMKDFYFFC